MDDESPVRKHRFSRSPTRLGCCRSSVSGSGGRYKVHCYLRTVDGHVAAHRKHRARADLLRGCRDTVCDGRQMPWLQLALTARRDGVAICLVLFGLLLRLLLGGSLLGCCQPPEGPAAAPRPPRCFADSAV